MAARYPVMLDLDGRPCLVVGGGEVAARKVAGLRAAGATVTVVAPELGAVLAAEFDAGALRWVQGPYAGLDVGDGATEAWSFVVAATDDPAVNATVSADCEAACTWSNDATSPHGGRAAVPATWRHGPVTLAVGTDGVHPSASTWLRDQAVAALRPEVLTAVDLVEELRLAEAGPGGLGRRPDWRSAVDSGMLDLIHTGHLAEAKERLQACLSSSSD